MKLSIIMPVYNEKTTVEKVIDNVLNVEPQDKEIVIVDDASTDGTRDILTHITDKRIKVVLHEKNCGKGCAVRTGLANANGDIVIMQDADFEYDPKEIASLIQPIKDGVADVVYGTRFTGSKPQRVHMFWFKMGNIFITLFANILYNATLTDVETCYKAFRTDFIKGLNLKSNSFDIEPELTAKVLKRHARLYEIPISYYGRSHAEGKKMRFYHGFEALWALLKYRFVD